MASPASNLRVVTLNERNIPALLELSGYSREELMTMLKEDLATNRVRVFSFETQVFPRSKGSW